MDKIEMIIKSIDWIFATVLLLGGRYFGTKYFRLSKFEALNFLFFASAFGIFYLGILHYTEGIPKEKIGNLFITYLVVTSFYEIIAQRVFVFIENLLGGKKETPIKEAVKKYELATGEKVVPDPGKIDPSALQDAAKDDKKDL